MGKRKIRRKKRRKRKRGNGPGPRTSKYKFWKEKLCVELSWKTNFSSINFGISPEKREGICKIRLFRDILLRRTLIMDGENGIIHSDGGRPSFVWSLHEICLLSVVIENHMFFRQSQTHGYKSAICTILIPRYLM